MTCARSLRLTLADLLWLRVSLEPKANRNGGMLAPRDFLPPGFVGVMCVEASWVSLTCPAACLYASSALRGARTVRVRPHFVCAQLTSPDWVVPSLFSVLFGVRLERRLLLLTHTARHFPGVRCDTEVLSDKRSFMSSLNYLGPSRDWVYLLIHSQAPATTSTSSRSVRRSPP